MPRPQHRRGGRVTRKGSGHGAVPRGRSVSPDPVDFPPVEQVLMEDAASALVDFDDVDYVEQWASSVHMLFLPVDLGIPPVLKVTEALAAAESYADPGAAAMVAVSISPLAAALCLRNCSS